ncbi:MAG: Zinc ribbon domain protein [candidate division BRC1 bacterium ADurb.BinA364]|nr:MAG: Zinc ribbon domain protein [candidate division BRC1 bacterium ADurb.BinA364]
MPVYEYKCQSCGVVVEKRVARMGDQPELKCECGNGDFKRLLSAPGIVTGVSPCGSKSMSCPTCPSMAGSPCGPAGCAFPH